ncbi:hypothetical protein KCU71_g587, partial [Aureobasidium melanogenum]
MYHFRLRDLSLRSRIGQRAIADSWANRAQGSLSLECPLLDGRDQLATVLLIRIIQHEPYPRLKPTPCACVRATEQISDSVLAKKGLDMHRAALLLVQLLLLTYYTLADDVGFDYDLTDLTTWEHDYGHYPYRTFESTDLTPPAVAHKIDSPACQDGLLTFLTPRGTAVNESRGMVILDDQGELVWMQKTEGQPYNLDVQTYQGAPHLTYWLGDDTVGGHGEGDYYLLNSSYDLVAKISALGDLRADLHSLSLTPNDTAIISIYEQYEKEKDGRLEYIWDCLFQEIDIATNSLIFQWRASDYHDTTESYHDPRYEEEGATNHTHWDWYHLNSVEKDDLGNYLVSARYTHSISYIDGQTGDLIWTLGGKRNMFTSDDHAFGFSSQHFAQFHSVNEFPSLVAAYGARQEGITTRLISLFDNRNDDTWDSGLASRGLLLAVSYPTYPSPDGKVNKNDYKARVVREYLHPNELVADSQGSLQVVPATDINQDPSILIGWGARSVWSSYSASGKLLCDDHFGTEAAILNGSVQSYHVMRYPWIGLPSEPISVVYNSERDSLFVSWNGATEVVSYALQHNDNSGDYYADWVYISITQKEVFETEVSIGGCVTRFVRVIALDVDENVLGVSEAMELPFTSGFHCDEINNMYITSDGKPLSTAPVALIMAAMSFTMFSILVFETWRGYKAWQKKKDKPPAIVLPDSGWKKTKPAVSQVFDAENPPELPFACQCRTCAAQYFPATVHVTNQEARQLVSSLVLDARQDLTFLRHILTNHADFIVTRWKKKSREKRFVFLSENIDVFDKKFAAIHLLHMRSSPENCDFNSELMRSLQGIDDPKMKEWFSKALHDMLSEDPSLLLALLPHRTTHELEDWILFDDMNADLAERFGIITQTFNPHCVVMQGADLGKLVNWNPEQAHRYQIIDFTKAYTILQAQQRMMAFLRKCITGLLDEANEPPVQQVHPKWDQLVSAGFSRIEPSFAWSNESARPFCSPPKFDSLEIHELAKSRHRVLKDHIELLQTDPAYVQHHARAYKNALFLETMNHGDKWPHIVDQVFLHPLIRQCYWRQMLYECDNMERAWLASVETPSEATRALYNDAILMVQDLCVEMLAVFIKLSSVIYQRGFERNFKFTGSGRKYHLNRKFITKD